MKMIAFEQRFVNAEGHSREVAAAAVRRLAMVPTKPGERLLDVGCGNGAAALLIGRTRQVAVTGVDIDPDQVMLARQSAEATGAAAGSPGFVFHVADAMRLPFDDATLHIVMTNKTLHHIAAWDVALAECARVVRPNGYLVVADFVAPRWLARAVALVGHGYRLATVARFWEVAQDLGLEVISETKSGVVFDVVWRKAGLARVHAGQASGTML